MKATAGRTLEGPAGTAVEVLVEVEPSDPVDITASLGAWFLHCPGQSPAWSHYILGCVHLRPVEGQAHDPVIKVEGATHEVLMYAVDPAAEPTALHPPSWKMLTPVNACEQVVLPSDELALELLELAVNAVINGVLPAEPALSGAREPWHSSMVQTAEHLRGEPHQ